jgi:hypothetical protein
MKRYIGTCLLSVLVLSSSGSHAARPKFEGFVNSADKAKGLVAFISQNMHKIVLLEVDIADNVPRVILERDKNSDLDSVTICNAALLSSGICNDGTSIAVRSTDKRSKDADLFCNRGVCRLRGYFAITGAGGPNGGIFTYAIKPLNVEDGDR